MKRKILSGIVLIVLLTFAVSCAQKSASYKALMAGKATYDTLLTSVGDMYKQGYITEAEKANVIEVGAYYKQLHNIAVGSLLQYETTEDLDDQQLYLYNLSLATAGLAQMIEIIKPLLEGDKL